MQTLKSILPYILGAAALVAATIFSTGRTEVLIQDLPTATPDPLNIPPPPTPTPTLAPLIVSEENCALTPQRPIQGYRPIDSPNSILVPDIMPGNRITVTGIVYASDCVTPLSDVLIEVWQINTNPNWVNETSRYRQANQSILRTRFFTNAEGQYQFITIKPDHEKLGDQFYPAMINFRLSYPDAPEILETRILFADDPYLGDAVDNDRALIASIIRQGGAESRLLHSNFDIVLPISPSAAGSTP